MKADLFLLALTSAVLLLVSPAAAQSPHPLDGKFFAADGSGPLDPFAPASLDRLMPCGAISILGEVHDNRRIHEMRGGLVDIANAARATGRCGFAALVFEHFDASQKPGLERFDEFRHKVRRLPLAADLFRFTDWEHSGWPSSDIFAPLMQPVVTARAPILAGNAIKAEVREVARNGLGAIDPERRRRLGLEQALEPALQDSLQGELAGGHCGMMPAAATANIALAQRLRDATMADVALTAARPDAMVALFTGNGHVRADRAIPWYIRLRAPQLKVVTIVFAETRDGKADPTAYLPVAPDGKPAADFIAFAAPAERGDPCQKMPAQKQPEKAN